MAIRSEKAFAQCSIKCKFRWLSRLARPASFNRESVLRQKVFGIGFHKTGTTSLKHALEHLGYRVTGPDAPRDPDIASKLHDLTRQLSQEFDGFQDNPWPLVYREMDLMWPDAKFILTFRDPSRWMASVSKHFTERDSPMRALIYGADKAHPAGNEEHYLSVYQAHNENVRDYYVDRPGKLLQMNSRTERAGRICAASLANRCPTCLFRTQTARSHDWKQRRALGGSDASCKSWRPDPGNPPAA